jgi:hypothetical protein
MKKQKKIFFPNKQPIVNRYLIKKPKEHSNNLIVRLIGQRLIVVLRREIEAIEKEIEDSN